MPYLGSGSGALDSPLYREMMAQTLRGSQRGSQYPGEAIANALATALQAYGVKKYGDKLQAKEDYQTADQGRAIANLLGPSDNSAWDAGPPTDYQGQPAPLAISPRVGSTDMQGRLAATGNADLLKAVGPQLIAQQLQKHPIQLDATGRAYDPYNTTPGTQFADPRLKSAGELDQQQPYTQTEGNDTVTYRYVNGVPHEVARAPRQLPPQPGAAKSAEAFVQEKELAQLRANAAAASQGDFGRSMLGKSYNLLSKGINDPAVRASPEYLTAWQIASNPQLDAATGTIITPDLSAFKPPIGAQQPGPPQPGAAPTEPTSPPGAPPQRMPNVTAFAPPNPSQAEAGSAGFANRLQASGDIIDKNQEAGLSLYNRTIGGNTVGRLAVSDQYKALDQAERNFVNAQLRRESGAVISPEEFDNAKKQYFPQPGDSPELLKQKKAGRDMAIRNMQLSAGNVLLGPGELQQAGPPRGVKPSPQTQGFGGPPAPVGGGAAPPAKIGRFTVEPVGP